MTGLPNRFSWTQFPMHIYSIMDIREHSLCGSVVWRQPHKLCAGGFESRFGFQWLVHIQFPIEARCWKIQELPWLEKSEAQVHEFRVFSWFRYHLSFNMLWESGFCISVKLIILKGTLQNSCLWWQWVWRHQCSIHMWKKCVLHSLWVEHRHVEEIHQLLHSPGEASDNWRKRPVHWCSDELGHEFRPQLVAEQCS